MDDIVLDGNATGKDVEINNSARAKESSLQLDNKLFLFDSVCTNFHVQVFLEQILSHLVLPFVPIFTNMRAQGFLNFNFAQIFFNYVVPFSVYLMIISHILSTDKQLGVLIGAIWVPLLFFVQHRLTVALKYASLSVTEYRKFQNCTDMVIAQKYVAQMELLRNWSSREEELIEFELGCASVRTATKLNEIFFVLHNPDNDPSSWNSMLHWNEFILGDLFSNNDNKLKEDNLGSTLSPLSHKEGGFIAWHNSFFRRSDGSYSISVHDVCKFVILRSDCPPAVLYFLNICGFFVIMLVTLFPFIQILQHPAGHSHWVIVFLAVSTFLDALMGMVYVLLLTVVIKDAVRHVHITQFLHSLIRLTDLRLQLHFTFLSPWSTNARNSLHNTQVQQREEAIARKNYHLIRSLTVQYSPEEAYNRLLSDYHLESSPLIGQPSFSAVSSSKTIDKDGDTNRSLLLRQFSKKKSTMVGEFLTTGDSALDAEQRPSTILPDINVTSSDDGIEMYSSTSTLSSKKLSKFRRNSKKLNPLNYRRDLLATNTGSHSKKNLSHKRNIPSRDNLNPKGRETNPKVDDLLDNAYTKLPRIDLNLPENVSAWIACRLALQHFGDRFRMRKEIYIAGNSLVILGFMVSVLVLAFGSSSTQQGNVFASVFVIQACLLIALSFVYIILLATFFALSNGELAQHQHTLSSHTLRMRNELVHMQELRVRWVAEKTACVATEASGTHDSDDEEEATRLHLGQEIVRLETQIASIERSIAQVTDALERIEGSLEVAALHTELKQQQLYGFNVDASLVFSLLTTAVTFFILLLGVYSSSVADAENSII